MTPRELTTEQQLSIIKYASQPDGCTYVHCVDCPAAYGLDHRCIMSSPKQSVHAGGANSQEIAQQYVQQHPKLFTITPEEITETFL